MSPKDSRRDPPFATVLWGVIGPHRDIAAPDVNTNAQVMAWIMDTLSMHAGFSVPGVVTGKPLSIGGSIGRSDATGQGIVYTIEATAERLGFKLDGATAAVQGFGNVGEASARLLYEAGARVVAITDIGGGVFDPRAWTCRSWAATSRSTALCRRAEPPIDRQRAAVRARAGLLSSAAMEGQVTVENAHTPARILAEGANGPPTSRPIRSRRQRRGRDPESVQPGGVIVSYFEWAQNGPLSRDARRGQRPLRRQILSAADLCGTAPRRQITPRLAAHPSPWNASPRPAPSRALP